MTSRAIWSFKVLARRIWFRATLFSIGAVVTALIAIVISPYIPPDVSTKIGADSVDNILGIIASSMLTVTTFSLTTMVSAFSAATSNVTPRATRLVMEDTTTQNVLATFLGSFLFSLVGIIALTTGAYGEQGRLVLFVVTIAIVVLIVITLLRWIDHLSRLGRVTETTRRVEDATLAAVKAWQASPNLGGHALKSGRNRPEKGDSTLFTDSIGYVQHVDAAALSEIAEEVGLDVVVTAIPGKTTSPAVPLGWFRGLADEHAVNRAVACFTIGDIRSFDQDPRFGASVLAEIGSRALSPGMNDAGTAIDVIGRAVRVVHAWKGSNAEPADGVPYPRLHVAPITIDDLFDDLFTPIARDGAALIEVQLRLQKALSLIGGLGPDYERIARRHAEGALERASAAMSFVGDIARLQNEVSGWANGQIPTHASPPPAY